MIIWNHCISAKRTTDDQSLGDFSLRTDFQRDFDRLIFSAPFRRLQNKTQVFPLPGSSTFVHNRLTHSLEVASVGRSLGRLVGDFISGLPKIEEEPMHFYRHDLSAVIASACLAHDVGNPAFGHNGEKAISNFFIQNCSTKIGGQELKSYFDEAQWADLIDFEGNANALRVLTHSHKGNIKGGLGLTYATLVSILKYPCESLAKSKETHRKKYNFFQSEKEVFLDIANATKMTMDTESPLSFFRHPFVYLVEAADDICYNIIDLEDAHRLGIVSTKEVKSLLMALIEQADKDGLSHIQGTLNVITDPEESASYLRAKVINALVKATAKVFREKVAMIGKAQYRTSLMKEVAEECPALKNIQTLSVNRIYNHPTVIKIELAGYKVMSGLLEVLVPAVLDGRGLHGKSLKLIPEKYRPDEDFKPYDKVMSVIDYISGMTDNYAMELYRNITGISIPLHG